MTLTAVPRRGATLAPGKTAPPRLAWLAIAAVALLIAVAGAVLRDWTSARTASGEVTGTLGGITATLSEAGWVAMDGHSLGDQGGYQMPAQMMPGAPTGDDMRLGIKLTLRNTDSDTRQFNLAQEFSLGGGRNDTPKPLHSDTFGSLSRLGPGSAVDGVLYFDTVVPGPDDPPLYLLWKRDGKTIQLAAPIGVHMPDHHSPA